VERLRVRTQGSGSPLVLVHGLSGSSSWWSRNVAALGARRTLHLVDLPRRGRLADAPSLVAELVESLGAQVALAGHSLGGLVCARAAALAPEHVGRLVLVAPAGLAARRSRLTFALPLARTAVATRPALALRISLDALRTGAPSLWRTSGELLADGGALDLERVTAPTLLVWGGRDLLVPPTLADAFLAALPDARLVVIPRAGHVPMWDRPREFERALLEFLED
jgi:pimeloyl-ACP methyl ester carboxylesterase